MDAILSLDSVIIKKLKNKIDSKKYLYGLNDSTKSALAVLANNDIKIDGFILAENQELELYTRCMNKPILCLEEICDDSVIIDLSGNNVDYLSLRTNCEIVTLYKNNRVLKSVILYGAGMWGKKAKFFLEQMGFHVLKYCDRNSGKVGKFLNQVEIISVDTLMNNYIDMPLVICIEKFSIVCEIEKELMEKGFKGTCTYFPTDLFVQKIIVRDNERELQLGYYGVATQRRESQRRELAYMGREPMLSEMIRKVKLLDVPVKYRIDIDKNKIFDNYGQELDKEEFQRKKEKKEIFVWVFPEAKELVLKELAREKTANYIYCYGDGLVSVEYGQILDYNMGYTKKSIKSISEQTVSVKELKIAVLGNSTSEDLFVMKTWLDFLKEIAKESCIKISTYNFAVTGYNVAQELILLERDVLQVKPDIVISLSGATEYFSEEENAFINGTQKNVFDLLKQDNSLKNLKIKNEVYFGINKKNYQENWIYSQRMMHAVCEEFGIKFYGIAQPTLLHKKNITEEEKSMLLYENIEELIISQNKIRSAVEKSSFPWMYDFKEIFDYKKGNYYMDLLHYTEEGNKVIAENIFEIIKKDYYKEK